MQFVVLVLFSTGVAQYNIIPMALVFAQELSVSDPLETLDNNTEKLQKLKLILDK